MLLRQSTIKLFTECALRYRFQDLGAEREQSSAMSFGTAIHDAVMHMEMDYNLNSGVDRFREIWDNLEAFDLSYDYLIPRYDHRTYMDLGCRILRDWWQLVQWDADVVLAREYSFTVALGSHTLHGTIDKLALRTQKDGSVSVLVSDYKTGSKAPTRDYLAHDIQFSAYCLATTVPEFWNGIENGPALHAELADAQREGEWVHLRGPKRIPAGPRLDFHYNRLMYACDQIEQSIALGIFVPDLTGEKCEFCTYRKICGLPTRQEEGLE